jgi:6-pyruvoyltetrahydropterin/6-carboxytetrahydropterin synthase
MFYLRVEADFAAAHQLREYQGKCENLHGHNWRVAVKVKGESLGSQGMLMDFTELKRLLGEVLGRLDHQFLNELPPFDQINPTSENLARHIYQSLAPRLPAGVAMAGTMVWESEKCSAIYKEGE